MKDMSVREIAFAEACGGALDEQIPEAELRKLLSNQPGPKLDADRILPVLANAVGWYRMMRTQDEHRLSRLEVADQARDTAAAAGNLLERLANMHPDLEAQVNDALHRLRGTHVLELHGALQPYLTLVQGALTAAESELRGEQTRRGPKRESERDIAFRRVYNALLGTPGLRAQGPRDAETGGKFGVEAARGLAADLLRTAEPGMPVPTDQDELRRIAGGGLIWPETEANNPG
jgi:hypothetical protein